MTYPPDPPSSTYRPEEGGTYLSDPGSSTYADEQAAYSNPGATAAGAVSGDSDPSTTDTSTTGAAKQQAAEVGGTAAQAGQQVAGVAKEQAANVAGQAKDEAKNLLGQTRTELTSQAGSQQQRAASGLRSLGDELQSMSSNSDGDGPASQVARRAAERIKAAASWLEDREPGQVMTEAQRFARQRPGAFLGLAAAAGLLAGRLTRGLSASNSSGPDQEAYRQTNSGALAGQSRQDEGMAEPGWPSTGTAPDATAYGAGSYGTEPYGTQPSGTEPYGTQPSGTQPYGPGVGSAQSFGAPTSQPPAWEQDPTAPAGDGGYGQPTPGSGEVGR